MAEADWHIRDLLLFYVSKCRGELLNATGDSLRAESMFDSVKRVREYMLLMSCMVGAITPAEIVALNKLDQIRLVAENESAQMLRIGDEMTMLRLWLKTALDVQWNVIDAVKLFKQGKLSVSSSFPEMTLDLLTSVNKPFVVPSELPSNSEYIQETLQASIAYQFSVANLPSRVCISFEEFDSGSVKLFAPGEFSIVGIFDNKRWTILEASILEESPLEYRRILQAINATSVDELCVAALRMATAQRLMQMQKEATVLLSSDQSWSSLFAMTKSVSGLGNGFTVSLFKNFPIIVSFEMNPDNGDLIISPPCETHSSFLNIIQEIEKNVKFEILTEISQKFFLPAPSPIIFSNQVIVFVNQTGSVVVQFQEHQLTAPVGSELLSTHLQAMQFLAKLHAFSNSHLCASPTLTEHVEITADWAANLTKIQPDKIYSVTLMNDKKKFSNHLFDLNSR